LTVGSAVLVSFGVGLATQGVLATTSSLVAALSVLTGAGFTHAVAFTVARRPVGSGTNLRGAVVTSTGTSLVVGILVALAGSNALPTIPVLWWGVAAALPFFQIGQFGLGLQQGIGSSRGYVTTLIAAPVTAFAVAVSAALIGVRSETATSWVWPLLVLPPIAQATVVAWQWRQVPHDGPDPLRMLISYTARIYPSAVAHFLSFRLDLLLVSALAGATSAGIYSLALSGVDAVARIGQTAATVLFRRFSDEDTARAASVARRAAIVTALLGGLGGLVIALAVVIGGRTRGPEVQQLGVLLVILSVAGGAICAWTVLASYLAATNRLGASTRVNFALLGLSVSIYVSLIPVIGVYGGAIGTSVGLLFAAALGYWEVARASRPTIASPAASLLRKPFGK
jgi:O-antigen/teichoic acid export membrane protein